MDRDEPGWLTTSFLCPNCGEYHDLVSEVKQLRMDAASNPVVPTPKSGVPPIKPGAPRGWCPWHETASPKFSAPCAWGCNARVHVHQEDLGPVKSGRAEKGYMVARCPACHRDNAVHPAYGKGGGIRTAKLDGDTPVVQLKMAKV